MHSLKLSHFLILGVAVAGQSSLLAANLHFRHQFISRELPITERGGGDYGLTALVDVDRDGDLDFILGGRGVKPSRLYWFEFQSSDRWVQHTVGTDYLSDVGLAPLDVDRDGWIDLVCSGVWYRNSGKPREQPFERIAFSEGADGAHDVLIADMNGDGRPDALTMGDERTKLNALCWFAIPTDVRQPWTRHPIGPPVHGAITPNGAADLDGDGDLDVLRADTWFENADGKGLGWAVHANIPMGRKGLRCLRAHGGNGHGRRWPVRSRDRRRRHRRIESGGAEKRRRQGRSLGTVARPAKLPIRFVALAGGRGCEWRWKT
jgi:hypothetical protein